MSLSLCSSIDCKRNNYISIPCTGHRVCVVVVGRCGHASVLLAVHLLGRSHHSRHLQRLPQQQSQVRLPATLVGVALLFIPEVRREAGPRYWSSIFVFLLLPSLIPFHCLLHHLSPLPSTPRPPLPSIHRSPLPSQSR